MQYSPDAFDSFIKQKLDEVEVDPSLSEKYWSKMNMEAAGAKRFSFRNKLFYFSICLIFLSAIMFIALNESEEVPVKNAAIKPTTLSNENKAEVKTNSLKPEQGYTQKITTMKPGLNDVKKNYKAPQERKSAFDKVTIETSSQTENINPLKGDVPISTINKSIITLPVIPRDSMRNLESIPPSPKKKKPVNIIW